MNWITLNRSFAEAQTIFYLLMISTNAIYEVGSTGCSDSTPHLPNAKFLGLGYDIVKGNPDGPPPMTASEEDSGLDPGFQLLDIIEHSYEEGKCENEYLVPDDVLYIPRSLTSGSCTASAVYGSRSYETALGTQVDIEAGTSLFTGFRFGASGGFKTFSKRLETEQSVYLTLRNLTTYGEGRIQPGYTLSHEFSSRLCALPTEYLGHEEKYHRFLDLWGTHVVIGATFGRSEDTLVQYQLSTIMLTEARKISGGVFIGGSYMGFGASIGISGSHDFNFQDYKATIHGSRTTSIRGSLENNEPIAYNLLGMDTVIEDGPCNQNNTLMQNMRQALASYPEYQGVQESADPTVFRLPLTWPDGTYTLPKSSNGCPKGDVSWAEGLRLFDTRHDNVQNRWEPDNIHLDLPIKEESRMSMKFCTKTTSQSANYRRDWDSGTYCTFRSGDACPIGFRDGSIFWNEYNTGNDNDYEGIVPAGEYTEGNTRMSFCCREDAESTNAIILPVDHDFFLMTPSGNCQEVFGMQSTKELFHWDTVGSSEVEGLHPYPGLKHSGTLKDVEIVFCYYQRNNISNNIISYRDDRESSDRQRGSTNTYIQGPCSNFLDLPSPAEHVFPSCVPLWICIISGILLVCLKNLGNL